MWRAVSGWPRWLRVALLAAVLASCLALLQASNLSPLGSDLLWIANRQIALSIDGRMSWQLYIRQGRRWRAANRAEPQAPPQRVMVAGQPVIDFQRQVARAEPVEAVWGRGERWTVQAESPSALLRQTTVIELYESYPQALLWRASYENLGPRPVTLDRLIQGELCLDASLWHLLNNPHSFWAFAGASWQWGQRIVFPLRDGLDQDNYLGQSDSGEGGGIPLVYHWNQQAGLALAHLEMQPQLWHMPLRVDERGRAWMGLERREAATLRPGERDDGVLAMLSTHRGDYYDPLRLYAELMAAQGWRMPDPSPAAYAPVWSGWGYEFDFTMDEMLGVIPMLQELGLGWATIDDRWFDAYGDWQPRRDTFPGGEADLRRLVQAYHEAGLLAQLWWYPLAAEDDVGAWPSHAYGLSSVVAEHPDWLILDEEGRPARNNRNLAILCPALPEVQSYIVALTERFIGEWGLDGLKLDNIYTVPPCHNPAHRHARPSESVEALPEVYRLIQATAKGLKPAAVTLLSPCGSTPNVYLLPYVDQPMMSDPYGSWQIRQRVKILKALVGPTAPVFADHVELTDNGQDFASMVGTGGVPGTKFVWPDDEAVYQRLIESYHLLTPEKEAHWRRWLALYDALRLSEGQYLNLYDVIHDTPEGHVIAKGESLYYAFFTDTVGETYQGVVELRGLQARRRYTLRNVETGEELGVVRGEEPRLRARFQSHILLVATPD